MEIVIKPKAFEWYKEELNLRQGDFVRFFPRYGGCSTVQTGFSLGIDKEAPFDPKAETTIGGVTFFIEDRDVWYLDGNNLVVDFNEQTDEPVFYIQ
ncbi:HesB/YadR/YfhF family protein [Anoxybacillus sp. J5B_2022]|uniref:HesB/YadR/YfhF family protein n=1 Tax=Anoxybacillus sp. J5B_2022 TaxID=3003246 RepID=UPI002286AAEE|nr:HesB/YadR/YfhF family protein [Anoxybacillus sp. J5B_2022]MCZ0755722.1 HesB/YadR/YfhF family protein [Anoxybacillus sp. J5B_2022]